MINKRILGGLIFILLIFVGCKTTIDPNPNTNTNTNTTTNSNNPITIIDEVKIEDENNIETKLLYRVAVNNGLNEETKEIKVTFINENIFEIAYKPQYGDNEEEGIKKEIVKVRMGKVKETKDSNNLNNITWKDLSVKGYLLEEAASGTSYKIIKGNKVYNLNKNGRLKEIKAYRNVEEKDLKASSYYKNLYNDEINILYSDLITKLAIIDVKNKKVIEDEFLKENNDQYNIFAIEDLIYIWTLETIEDPKYDEKMKIGYIKDNNFQDIFDKDNLIIKNQKLTFPLYGYVGENKVLLSGNKILFSGVVNDINGIWHYNLETKELSLQIKLKDFEVSYMFLSADKEMINISTTIIDEDETLKSSSYIGRLNEDFKVTELKNFVEEEHGIGNKHFLGFYEDSKKVYYKSILGNEAKNMEIYEVYEILN